MPLLSIITLVNDPALYALSRESLAEQFPPSPSPSSDALQWIPIHADLLHLSAAQALNHGLAQARADWILCAHQDVLFPDGWWTRAKAQLDDTSASLVGLVGVDAQSRFFGHVFEPRGHFYWGPLPHPVTGLDEHVLLIRRYASLRFDPDTPGFHCYGTDLALQARARKLGVIAIDAPVVHLSTGTLNDSFRQSSQWLLKKWRRRSHGVLPTPAALISDPSVSTFLRRLCARYFRRRSGNTRVCHCPIFHPPSQRAQSLELQTSSLHRQDTAPQDVYTFSHGYR